MRPRLTWFRPLRRTRYWLPAALVLVGVATSVAMFITFEQRRQRMVRTVFKAEASSRVSVLKTRLERLFAAVHGLAGLYEGSERVTWREFQGVTAPMLERHPGLEMLFWVPRVPAERREALEAMVPPGREEPIRIREQTPEGELVPAGERSTYFPLYHVRPVEGHEWLRGFDLASREATRKAMVQARERKQVMATEPIVLASGRDAVRSVWVFRAVKSQPLAGEEMEPLEGFVGGAFRTETMLAGIVPVFGPRHMVLEIHDAEASPDEDLIYTSQRDEASNDEPPSDAGPLMEDDGPLYADSVEVAGRQWQILAQPTLRFLQTRENWTPPLLLLASGVGLSLLLGGYLHTVLARRDRVEREVGQRTEELRQEVDQRRRYAERVREAEAFLESVVENIPLMIAIQDAETLRFVRLNQAATDLLGCPREELIGKRVAALLPPEGAERFNREARKALQEGRMHEVAAHAVHTRHRGPRMFHTKEVPLKDPSGRVTHLLAIAEDITERKEAEEALRDSERRERARAEELATVMEAAPAIILIAHDPGATRITGNRTACELLRSPAEANLSLNAPPEERPRHFTLYRDNRSLPGEELPLPRAARGEEIENYEYWIVFEDGVSRCIFGNAVPLRDEHGAPRGSVGAFIDITERKRLVDRLARLNKELEQRVAARTAELEHRADQLRRLASQLTQAEQQERRRLAQILHDHLQQLLAAAKMQAGRLTGTDSETAQRVGGQLTELLDEAIDSSRSLSHELSPQVLYERGLGPALQWLAPRMESQHGLRVHVAVEEAAEPTAEEAKVLLFQAVRELLFNIIKHAGTDEAWIRMERIGRDGPRIEVEDRGAGFDPERIDVGGGGEQLGLFGLRERLELMGGKMEIDSAPGEGTRVTLLAPRADEMTKPAEQQHEAPDRTDHVRPTKDSPEGAADRTEQANGSIRVMLVDDHKIVREGLAGILSAEPDIELVAEASDGRDAVERVENAQPDVIVMDVSMPRMNGEEATRVIVDHHPEVRVIGLSMHSREDLDRAMREAGASAYLTKGGPASELIEAVRRHARARPIG